VSAMGYRLSGGWKGKNGGTSMTGPVRACSKTRVFGENKAP
jgi:hypothetical protein